MSGVPSAYCEFAVQSNFSFLRGASAPEELVVTATRQGHKAMGLADRNTVAGVVRAWQQARIAGGLAYHPGCRLVFSDDTPDILAYPQHRAGWGHLCRLLTVANARGEKGAPDVRFDDIMEWGEGLSLALIPDFALPKEQLTGLVQTLASRFGKNLRIAISCAYQGDDAWRLAQADCLAGVAGVALMAVGDVLYHDPHRRMLHDTVTAIRLKRPVADAGLELAINAERHLKEPAEMARLFHHYPDAIAETVRFAQSLNFSLKELKYHYPQEPGGQSKTPQAELERLTWEGARKRYPHGAPDAVCATIKKELALVDLKDYAPYFLTVHDIVCFARSKDILCQGRGSAANSVICYCLGITDVNPQLVNLLFERFISAERDEPPDIDVDFEHERRSEVIAYIYEKYSRRRTALAASVVTYRSRSAMRETAKALGLSDDVTSALSGSVWGWSASDMGAEQMKAAGLNPADMTTRHLFERANEIAGFPRHLSQHVGGFVITNDRLDEVVPIIKTAMEERKMVEWDKDDLDAIGILKVDILALGMLSCLRRCFHFLKDHYGLDLTLDTVPKEESQVYDMICRADTLGVFQIESRAQMTMLPRLKPRAFYDLVIEVAIVRPGPIQGDMVHPYLRRRQGKEKPEYPRPELEAILSKTLGVPLFQEQAMRIAIEAGGFTPGEADQLRRAMATFRRVGTIGTLRNKMIDGMVAKGYERDFAERCFKQIEGFGEYGFPESHAASFALLVYASCWFKAHYPDVFCAAILNAQPMGFYAPAQLVRDARDHGIDVRPVDINFSNRDSTLEPCEFNAGTIDPRHRGMAGVIRSAHAVRLGLRQIKGLSQDDSEKLVANRGRGYDSVRDLWLRSGLSRAVIERLAAADAFRSLGLDRRNALWAAGALDEKSAAERLPLFERRGIALADLEAEMVLPVMPLGAHVIHDYKTVSLSLKAHPVSFIRDRLDNDGTIINRRLDAIANGRRITVAGLVLVRQRPGSAKGVIFMTIEDETGVANIIVWPKTFERYRAMVMGARLVRVRGRLQSQDGVIHIVAERIENLTPWLAALSENAIGMDGLANADEVRRPVMETRAKTRAGSKLARLISEVPALSGDYAKLVRQAGAVMPKGRNFH